MIPEYIPYIKYVIAPGTRFERDSRIFFDAKGSVSRGETLKNYGWSQTGFKELIEALYFSKNGSVKGFEDYFKNRIKYSTENIVDVLRKDGIISDELRGLIRLKITDKMAIPVLLTEITEMRYKFCYKPRCSRLWENGKPPEEIVEFLRDHNLPENILRGYGCTRHLCYNLCGAYKQCELMYTSVEGQEDVETKILRCLIELLKQKYLGELGSKKFDCRLWTPDDHRKKKIGASHEYSKCFERPVRFNLKPLRYYILDPKMWKEIEEKRYNKNPNNQFDAFPAEYLPDIFEDKLINGYTELSVPLRTPGVLECFLQLAAIKFELKHDLQRKCNVCGGFHRITRIPIKAMFRNKSDEVYCQESGFAELLWNLLWMKCPQQMCQSFGGKSEISPHESRIIRRELKVKELVVNSRYAEASYDFAVNFEEINNQKKSLVFDLTTALWKKSGIHETSIPPEEHLNKWKETLCQIPNSLATLSATWYIVVNQTEEMFFDETAPSKVKNIDELVSLVCNQHSGSYIIIREPQGINSVNLQKHKLLVVPVFNSTPQKGEARYELLRLFKRDFSNLLINQVVDFLLEGLK
jgi:hypothetical protein